MVNAFLDATAPILTFKSSDHLQQIWKIFCDFHLSAAVSERISQKVTIKKWLSSG